MNDLGQGLVKDSSMMRSLVEKGIKFVSTEANPYPLNVKITDLSLGRSTKLTEI
jgi:hypothetical protein